MKKQSSGGWFRILIAAANAWRSDNTFKHSAAVSFYTLFSLAPVSVIAVGITGFFLGKERANKQLIFQATQLVGESGAKTIQEAVEASANQDGSVVSTVVGIVLLIVGATTVFGQLQDSLNDLWNVRSKPSRSGWVAILLQRLVSFAMVVTVGFLLLVSLVVSTALAAVTSRYNAEWMPLLAKACDISIGLAVITVLFTAVFKVMPDVKLRWRDAWGSALLTAILFSAGRYLIALYLGHSTVASIYGAAGSLVALLVWVYYSCAIMFFGVEYMRASHEARGIQVTPKKTAVLVREELIEERIQPPGR